MTGEGSTRPIAMKPPSGALGSSFTLTVVI